MESTEAVDQIGITDPLPILWAAYPSFYRYWSQEFPWIDTLGYLAHEIQILNVLLTHKSNVTIALYIDSGYNDYNFIELYSDQ